MSPGTSSNKQPRVDRTSFGLSVALMLAMSVPLLLAPEAGGEVISKVYDWIASHFGVVYQWAMLGSAIFLAWLACSRYGRLRLGPDDSQPEFSTFAWFAMLFCAGVGAGLMYWCVIEWAHYANTPPFGLAPGSEEAMRWASSYGIYHWGISAWCLYCLPAVAIAVPFYRKRLPSLRLSTGLHGLLGDDAGQSPLARSVDLIFIVALLGGAGTSLGLATPMIATVGSRLFGYENGFAAEAAIVFLCMVVFAISVYLGLGRGIKRLSTANTAVAFVLLGFVVVAGPTLYLLRLSTESLGFMLQNFLRMSTYTDALTQSDWVKDWSIFYWAWWIAYSPFVGLFTTRVSKGRTVRELILGMTLLGAAGCAVFYCVLGNYALYQDVANGLPVRELVAQGEAPEAITQVLASLPLDPLGLILFGIVALVFAATTYDSGSYAIAAAATLNLRAGSEPNKMHRIFWAFALGILPLALMLVGGLRAIQSAVLVVSLPVVIVGVLMTVSLVRTLREEANLVDDLDTDQSVLSEGKR